MKHQNGKENRLRYVYDRYGFDEWGFADLPKKVGPYFGEWIGANRTPHVGCVECYMEGNLTAGGKHQDARSWKRHRRTQWRDRNKEVTNREQ